MIAGALVALAYYERRCLKEGASAAAIVKNRVRFSIGLKPGADKLFGRYA